MGWDRMRLRVPLERSLFMASKPRAIPIIGTKRAMKVVRDGIALPEVVNSFRKTKKA